MPGLCGESTANTIKFMQVLSFGGEGPGGGSWSCRELSLSNLAASNPSPASYNIHMLMYPMLSYHCTHNRAIGRPLHENENCTERSPRARGPSAATGEFHAAV